MDYLTPLQDFFETFTWDIESKYNSNEVTLIEKTLFFIKEEFDATRTEFYITGKEEGNFLHSLWESIKKLKNAIHNLNVDYIEIDSQLMAIHYLILNQYQELRGTVWSEKYSKVVLSSNARKGGRFSSSIYDSQRKQAEQIYIEFKKQYPHLIEDFSKNNKAKKPKTTLKDMLKQGITEDISERTFERWSCNLLKNNGILVSDNNK